jgi:hypothetical protein
MNIQTTVERRARAIPAAIACGCVALAARSTSAFALAPTIAVGVVGLAGAVRKTHAEQPSRARIATVTLIGVAAISMVRLIAPPLHTSFTGIAFVVNVVAAVAEEAFFRRFVYGWLAARSQSLAIVGAAALFAIIHIPIWGIGVLPIDFAAGLLLGWQRREAGTWLLPAVTHIFANVIQMR